MKKLLMGLVLMPMMALADAEKVGDVTWSYKVESEKVTVKRAEPCEGKLEIPQALGGHLVSGVGPAAFFGCEDLTELVIPEGVAEIGAAAFCDCSGLTSVTIPSTLTSIADAAFEGCDSLTTVCVSAGDTEDVKAMIADSDSGIDVDSLTFVELLPDGGPYTETVDGIEWTFYVEGGKAMVGSEDSWSGAVSKETVGALVIPSILGGCPVTSIGDDAFYECSGLTSVTISEGVTSIGDGAFCYCNGLTSVTIPEGVTSIGWSVFACSGLTSVTIPSSVTSIGESAFCNCSGLTSVTIPSNVMIIGNNAFGGCSGLTSVTIPSSVTSIGDGAFCECSGLMSILVDDGNALYCSQDGVLYDDAKTELLAYPGGKSGSFAIPSSVTSIGELAFCNCSGLTSVAIPAGVASIGYAAFRSCSGLVSISVDEGNSDYSSVDGVLYDKAKTKLLCCPGGKVGDVAMPESVTSIGDSAFFDCGGLTSVRMPECVMNIGEAAFYGCSGLTSLAIPEGVTSIRYTTFYGCSGLASVTIPARVTSIGDYAFGGCSGLEKVYVSAGDVEGVKEMLAASYSDLDVDSLTFVEMLPDGGPYTETVDGIEWTFCVEGGKAMVGSEDSWSGAVSKEAVGALVIPSILGGCPVTSIGDDAFYECSGLTSVTIPEGVTSIGDGAFCNCSGLTSVTIPEGVTSIGWSVFAGSGLTSVVIPSSVTSIGESAFCNCSGLTSVTIPSNVMSIGDNAFGGCSGLTSVTIPSSVTSIGKSAFYRCGKITTAMIPARFRIAEVFPDSFGTLTDVTVLSSDGKICDRAFEDCRCLTSVVLSGDVTEIGESAFENCRHLESITIPATAKKIDAYAFYGCGRLKTVNYLGEKPEIEGAAFVGTGVEQSPSADVVNVVVSNVIVQYVFNSVQPEFAIPATSDTGFVNIITEVKGGAVAVPATWAEEYPNFVGKFGSDFTKALAMKTGKKDGAGNDMQVWQDYVAGTDPTDEKDVFTASITIVDGKVTISYSPELDDARKEMRKYTIWGKTSLMDTDWTEVRDGHEAEYNFFKVSVEMR